MSGRRRANVGHGTSGTERRANVGQADGGGNWKKSPPKKILDQRWAKYSKKGTGPLVPKKLWKLNFQNTQKLKMWGVNFGESFGREKGKDPNFGMAELHFWVPSPHVFMTAESGLKASSIKPHVCPLKNNRTGWMPSCVWARWEHDSKGVFLYHANVFILSIVM